LLQENLEVKKPKLVINIESFQNNSIQNWNSIVMKTNATR